jgi:hypothetical protein
MMTKKEVEAIIRQQQNSLTNPNPYVDDYYHYAVLCSKALQRLGGGAALSGIVPREQSANLGKMLLGRGSKAMPSHVRKSLGQIAKWSANTPRQLMALPQAEPPPPPPPPTEAGVDAAAAAPLGGSGGAAPKDPEPSTPPPPHGGGAAVTDDRAFPLRVRGKIEVAMGLLYQLEEYDRAEQLPESAGPGAHREAAAREAERRAQALKLLRALEVVAVAPEAGGGGSGEGGGGGVAASTTTVKAQPCRTMSEILVSNPGDEYFVAMCRLPKGRRLLRRAIPLLVPEFSQALFSAVFRNIGVLQMADANRSQEEVRWHTSISLSA